MRKKLFSALYFLAQLGLVNNSFAQANLRYNNFPYDNVITLGKGSYFISSGASVYNTGNTASVACYMGYYLSKDIFISADDVFLGETTLAAIAPGSNIYNYPAKWQIPSTLAAGEYWLINRIDNRSQVTETQENDNEGEEKVVVQETNIDLSSTLEELSGQSFTQLPIGKSAKLILATQNIGNTSTYSSTGIYLSVDSIVDNADVLLGEFPDGELYAGKTASRMVNVSFPSTWAPGNYFLISKADFKNSYAEGNEKNNFFVAKIGLSAPIADLYTELRVQSFPTTVPTGVYIRFQQQLSIRLRGNYTLQKPNYRFVISTDTLNKPNEYVDGIRTLDTFSVFDIILLEKRDSVFIPNGLPKGIFYLGIQMDPNNQLTETNEQNNRRWLPLTVKYADTVHLPGGRMETLECTYTPTSIQSCQKTIRLDSIGRYTCLYWGTICKIRSEDAKPLELQFTQFKMGNDTILIFDNEKLVGKYTGDQNPGMITSAAGNIRIARGAGYDMPGNEQFTAVLSCNGVVSDLPDDTQNLATLLLYPNPSTGLLQVQTNLEKGKMELINALGSTVMSFNDLSRTLDLSQLPKGTYWLRCVDQHMVLTRQFVLK